MIHFLVKITVESCQESHNDFIFLISAHEKEGGFNMRWTTLVKGNEKSGFFLLLLFRLLNLPLKSLVSC